MAVLAAVALTAACSPYYSQEPGPGFPPVVHGITWTGGPDYDSDCALGLTVDGLTFVAGAGTPWGLGAVAAEWLSYKITGNLLPVGASVGDCWNSLVNNAGQFGALISCAGQPAIRHWFDSVGAMQAWVSIPYCRCNLTCQGMANGSIVAAWKAQARAEQRLAWCQVNWWQDFTCAYPSPNGWHPGGGLMAVEDSGPEVPPEGPLPVEWGEPWWDTTVPVPPLTVPGM